MVRCRLAGPALLSLAGSDGTDIAVDGIVFGVLRVDRLACRVFFRRIFRVAFLELELGLALAALNEVAHFPDGLVLEYLKLLVSDEAFDLVLHHVLAAAGLEALEVASMADELGVDVLVDAGHAEDVPAVVDVEEHISVEVLVVLPLTVAALNYLGRIDRQVCLNVRLLLHPALYRLSSSTFLAETSQYLPKRSTLFGLFKV